MQVNLLQQNPPLKKALQAACGRHRWKEPRAVQVALGAMHSFVLIYTPSRLMPAAAGVLLFCRNTGIPRRPHALLGDCETCLPRWTKLMTVQQAVFC